MIERRTLAALSLSASAFVTLLVSEHYTSQAVIPVKGDVPTYGFGSTTRADGSKVRMNDRIEPTQAVQRSFAYVAQAEAAFKRCVQVPLSQAEYDLYMDFGYQYGIPTLCGSSIVKHLNAREYRAACESLLPFRKVAGRDCSLPENWGPRGCKGVWTRQQERYRKCMDAQQ